MSNKCRLLYEVKFMNVVLVLGKNQEGYELCRCNNQASMEEISTSLITYGVTIKAPLIRVVMSPAFVDLE